MTQSSKEEQSHARMKKSIGTNQSFIRIPPYKHIWHDVQPNNVYIEDWQCKFCCWGSEVEARLTSLPLTNI